MKYDVIRRPKRRGVTLKVTKEGEIVVFAGLDVSDRRIAEFVEANSKWIERTTKRMFDLKKVKEELDDENYLTLHGVRYPVKYIFGEGKSFVGHEGVTVYYKESRSAARGEFFSEYAKDYLVRRFDELTKGVCPVKVKRVKGYFGIFHRDNGGMYIALNESIVHARKEVSDMIIYHELTHIGHAGHGRDFYEELSKLCPDHRALRKELNATVKL